MPAVPASRTEGQRALRYHQGAQDDASGWRAMSAGGEHASTLPISGSLYDPRLLEPIPSIEKSAMKARTAGIHHHNT